jgi:hypothetical protein
MATPISITNLAEFRADLRAAAASAPRDLTKALRLAGAPIVAEASSLTPVRSGALAKSYRASVSGTTGRITSTVPYAGGAEFGRFGKWKGFGRYGASGGRFAGRSIDDQAEVVLLLIGQGLKAIIEIRGWAS